MQLRQCNSAQKYISECQVYILYAGSYILCFYPEIRLVILQKIKMVITFTMNDMVNLY